MSLPCSLEHFSENDISVKVSGKRQFHRNGKVGAWRMESRSSTKTEARLGRWRLGAGMESSLHLTWLNCSIQTPAWVLLSSRGSPQSEMAFATRLTQCCPNKPTPWWEEVLFFRLEEPLPDRTAPVHPANRGQSYFSETDLSVPLFF